MPLIIGNMSKEFAEEILNWQYDAPYDFYNNKLTADGLKEMLENQYYAVLDQNDKLFGFFCIGDAAKVPIGIQLGGYSEEFIDIGIGMKPELTGQGYGNTFFSFILGHIQDNFNDGPIRLTVAKFNQRAIHLYEKFGFVKKMEFKKGSTAFITMVK
ncbi:GNAT family N-acetyltransferase [Bacillus sp. FJAT-27251]|uniref:GNAT family N-acetyltransferase n=1 Tax=Bacillus sp. FJAT-27251 TaxID=1684142 RepID=UPI0006A7A678|nr:GNAT family N-acetyltransferase [Bacillus sp. FJAT-27251]